LRRAPRRASQLADELNLPRPAMSRHLRVLRKSGLVSEREPEHDARVREYRLEPQCFAELRAWVTEVEGFWGKQLAAFKAHAKRQVTKRRA
jgi:DNA-binding MarR family transcriptional regulator